MKTGNSSQNKSKADKQKLPRSNSLANALFTATQQKVLAIIFGQPERTFYTREIIALASVGIGSVHRELNRLTECGLVNMTRVGNQKHFRANKTSPIFEELHGIIQKTLGIPVQLKTALEPLSERIELAILYGSVAKNEDRASSDIDVLIVSDFLLLNDVYELLLPLEAKLARTINPTVLTKSEFSDRKSQKESFLWKVLSGKTIKLIGQEDVTIAA